MDRLLVRLPNWLGVALLARPLLYALRGAFPRAEIRLVSPAPIAELLAGDPVADAREVWARERGGGCRAPRAGRDLRAREALGSGALCRARPPSGRRGLAGAGVRRTGGARVVRGGGAAGRGPRRGPGGRDQPSGPGGPVRD